MKNIFINPKDSNVYSNDVCCNCTTPSGSHSVAAFFFYKHKIPSGLISIQIGLEELKPFVQ